jgi:membrane dipeptidase
MTEMMRSGAESASASILRTADVWDMTLPWIPVYWDLEVLARYRRAGFTFVSASLQDWPPSLDGMRVCIEQFKEIAKPANSWLTFGSSLSDIDRGRVEGKLVIGVHSHDTRPIGEDLSRIGALHALGVRHMLLAYQVRNLVADGCAEVADGGLSNFGRQVVREMNRVGIIVDCSHTGRRSSLEAIELSELPVIFSHSNAFAIAPHVRNITDDQIRACAARGGVIGVVGVGAYLGDLEARSESMFSQIDYITNLVGPKHVGLGTDYIDILPVREHTVRWETYRATHGDVMSWPNRANAWPDSTQLSATEGRCFAPEQLVDLVEIMLERGYSAEVVKDIVGGNFRRVYATVLQQ